MSKDAGAALDRAGQNDPRVNIGESDQMVAALKKRGIDVPYLVKDNEGHGFRNEENRFEFYEAMEKFWPSTCRTRECAALSDRRRVAWPGP